MSWGLDEMIGGQDREDGFGIFLGKDCRGEPNSVEGIPANRFPQNLFVLDSRDTGLHRIPEQFSRADPPLRERDHVIKTCRGDFQE